MVQADECLEDKKVVFEEKITSEKLHCQKYFKENPYWAHNEAIIITIILILGKRIPNGFEDRPLPHFKRHDMHATRCQGIRRE